MARRWRGWSKADEAGIEKVEVLGRLIRPSGSLTSTVCP